MKNRFIFIFVCFFIVLIALFFLCRPQKKVAVPALTQEIAKTILDSPSSAIQNSNIFLTSAQYLISNGLNPDRSPEVIRKYMESQNKTIKFCGKAIDQNGYPLADVSVQATVTHIVVITPAPGGAEYKLIKISKFTDAGGRFEINGETGDGIGIGTMTKSGYLLSPKAPRGFSPESGSYENPVIFNMWKEGDKAQLVTGSKFGGIIPDGRIYTIDLLQGTKVESADAAGDFRLSVRRPMNVARQDRYDWTFQIVPIKGGIIETEDDFMYLAPENGYLPEYKFQLNKSDAKWTDDVKKSFYVRTRDGQNYGRINVEIFAHYQNNGVLSFDWAVNPAGSRNLQP
jgi:hypothetical protein